MGDAVPGVAEIIREGLWTPVISCAKSKGAATGIRTRTMQGNFRVEGPTVRANGPCAFGWTIRAGGYTTGGIPQTSIRDPEAKHRSAGRCSCPLTIERRQVAGAGCHYITQGKNHDHDYYKSYLVMFHFFPSYRVACKH